MIRGGKRFDREICKLAKEVDEATGVDGLFGFEPKRPKNQDLEVFLQPPDDLAAWARSASAGGEVASTEIDSAQELRG